MSIPLTHVFHWDSVPNPDTPCSTINPPAPLFKGAITAFGLSIATRLPCPPTPARHLMTCLNPPNPLFKGAHQGLRAFHRRMAALPASSGPASDDALSFGRCFFACIVLKKGYQCWAHDATHKSLIITALDVFRVCVFATLKTVKQLSLSDLQVTLHVSARQQGCPREDLPPSVLFFIGTLSQGS